MSATLFARETFACFEELLITQQVLQNKMAPSRSAGSLLANSLLAVIVYSLTTHLKPLDGHKSPAGHSASFWSAPISGAAYNKWLQQISATLGPTRQLLGGSGSGPGREAMRRYQSPPSISRDEYHHNQQPSESIEDETSDSYPYGSFVDYPFEQFGHASERFDERHHHHKELEHHQEAKEISFVYPVVLALLILGALFIPFISLFFFLAVSAFNCNSGLAGSFSSVTPIFGRRRRRRRSLEAPSSSASAGLLELVATTDRLEGRQANGTATTTKTTTLNKMISERDLITSHLPVSMLFDALAANSTLVSTGWDLMGQDYGAWRKQLARNTIRLRDALLQFGSDLVGS